MAKEYKISDRAKLFLSLGDLTAWTGDAIVNAGEGRAHACLKLASDMHRPVPANERMLGGGGVDGAIHRAAGRGLYQECRTVPQVEPGVRCPTGEARITRGYELPAKHVIHTVGPIYDNDRVSAPLLDSAYRSSLKLANENGLKTIAFPAISTGVFGYPKDKAAEVSLQAVAEAVGELEEVHFVLFGKDTMEAWVQAADKQFPEVSATAAAAVPADASAGAEGAEGADAATAPPAAPAEAQQQRTQAGPEEPKEGKSEL